LLRRNKAYPRLVHNCYSKVSTRRGRFQFTNHRQEVFNSRAYYETRPTSILGSDCDERASHYFSGDLKYSTTTGAEGGMSIPET